MGKPEGRIENHLKQIAEDTGFLYFKFTSPGRAGVPDRILIGNGHILFIELKAPGEEPRKLQEITIRNMRNQGADVRVIDSKQDCNRLIDRMKARKGPYPVPNLPKTE